DAAQWRGSDLNRRAPGNEPGEDSARLPRSMRRGFTRSSAPGAASAPTGRRSAAVVVVVVRRYETMFVCTYTQDLRKRRARHQEHGTEGQPSGGTDALRLVTPAAGCQISTALPLLPPPHGRRRCP